MHLKASVNINIISHVIISQTTKILKMLKVISCDAVQCVCMCVFCWPKAYLCLCISIVTCVIRMFSNPRAGGQACGGCGGAGRAHSSLSPKHTHIHTYDWSTNPQIHQCSTFLASYYHRGEESSSDPAALIRPNLMHINTYNNTRPGAGFIVNGESCLQGSTCQHFQPALPRPPHLCVHAQQTRFPHCCS